MTAVVRANASILEIQAAISVSNAENLYAHATEYCLALLDCEIIDDAQWQVLHEQAGKALTKRKAEAEVKKETATWPSINRWVCLIHPKYFT